MPKYGSIPRSSSKEKKEPAKTTGNPHNTNQMKQK
jgi:hypothetical protein